MDNLFQITDKIKEALTTPLQTMDNMLTQIADQATNLLQPMGEELNKTLNTPLTLYQDKLTEPQTADIQTTDTQTTQTKMPGTSILAQQPQLAQIYPQIAIWEDPLPVQNKESI
ncbi:hypothetical protein LQZ18_08080 [Lachnospiraceae bacterium ZAX-1]